MNHFYEQEKKRIKLSVKMLTVVISGRRDGVFFLLSYIISYNKDIFNKKKPKKFLRFSILSYYILSAKELVIVNEMC